MRLFGTDGIRAPFGEHPLDQSTVRHLGYRLAQTLAAAERSPLVVMGGDTRENTLEISQWSADGLEAGGARVSFGGVLPTPAVARAVLDSHAAAGVSISASHNPHPYNGIKLFDREGYKWSPEAEEALENRVLDSQLPLIDPAPPLSVDPEIGERYRQHLTGLAAEPSPLTGLRIVLDTAHGAATPFAESLFSSLGAEVIAIGNQPDGRNINDACGSTAPEALLAAVRDSGADLGIAFDGDADRALIADETGRMKDGDAMMYAWARSLRDKGALDPPCIVATSMSNLGLETALRALEISVVRCDVGDRTVVATMRERGIRLGGEQSGHLVDLATSTTGDGLATALQMTMILKGAGTSLSSLLEDFRRFPQVLRNVEVATKPDLESLPDVARIAAEIESTLGDQGRLVLRYSGTEPLARVMIEGPELTLIDDLAQRLLDAIQEAVGSQAARGEILS